MANIYVSAIASWNGKALTKGDKQLQQFGMTAKNLSRTLTAAFSVVAIERFGKASLKAFAEDEKQIAILTQTLKNAGAAMSAMGVNHFVDGLALASGVAKTELIPAFDKLFLAIGDVTKAQDALKLAMDVSAGTGKDLQAVSQALAKGYLGNTTSLTRLGAGLDKALLKTGDMVKITGVLAQKFKGDAAAAADTFAGKMARIGTAVEQAKVNIGRGLVDALMKATASTTIDELQNKIYLFGYNASQNLQKFGAAIQSNIDALKVMAGVMAAIWVGGKIASGIQIMISAVGALTAAYVLLTTTATGAAIAEAFATGGLSLLAGEAAALAVAGLLAVALAKADKTISAVKALSDPNARVRDFGAAGGDTSNADKASAKRAAADLAAAKKTAAQQAALAKKDAVLKLALAKGNALFDINRIEIAAALKSTYDEDTRKRLLLLQAIQEGDADLILKRMKELADFESNAAAMKLAGIKTISDEALQAANALLIVQLQNIEKSKMSEADKYAAEQEAFRLYNAAIAEQGGMEEKQYQSALTQNQLLTIARLSGINDVRLAQLKADNERQAAQDKYLASMTMTNNPYGLSASGVAAMADALTNGSLSTNVTTKGGPQDRGNPLDAFLGLGGAGAGQAYAGAVASGQVFVLPTILSDTPGLPNAVQKIVQEINRNGIPLSGNASVAYP